MYRWICADGAVPVSAADSGRRETAGKGVCDNEETIGSGNGSDIGHDNRICARQASSKVTLMGLGDGQIGQDDACDIGCDVA